MAFYQFENSVILGKWRVEVQTFNGRTLGWIRFSPQRGSVPWAPQAHPPLIAGGLTAIFEREMIPYN